MFSTTVLGLLVLGAERLPFEIRETAGLARFNYPVTVRRSFEPPLSAGAQFRLLAGDRPVAAQFTAHATPKGEIAALELDFETSLKPHEVRAFALEYGPDIPATALPTRGISVEETPGAFIVRNGSQEYRVPQSLEGLLASARGGRLDFVRSDSLGLALRINQASDARLAPASRTRVVKRGPFAVLLEFDGNQPLAHRAPVTWRVQLQFPRSKSWVRVTQTANDASNLVSGLGMNLSLELDVDATFVDFGATSLVYLTLLPGQRTRFTAGEAGSNESLSWAVRRGVEQRWDPYVAGVMPPRHLASSHGLRCEGWAHAMDRTRCTAIAVEDFALGGRQISARKRAAAVVDVTARPLGTIDAIEIGPKGTLRVWREYPPSQAESVQKTLTIWLHFVSMPPHLGAITSPQSMQLPPTAHWLKQ